MAGGLEPATPVARRDMADRAKVRTVGAWCRASCCLGLTTFALLALGGCAAQPEGEQARRGVSGCPAFTRPDTIHRDGVTMRACSDRHGNVVCVQFGRRMHCRDDDGASLINPGS